MVHTHEVGSSNLSSATTMYRKAVSASSLSDVFSEILVFIIASIFIGMTLYAAIGMSEQDRTDFIIMMQMMGNQE